MSRQYLNAPASTLSGSMTNVATTLSVASASSFPTSGEFNVLVDSGANAEIMRVTGVSGTTFTVTRASESYPGGASVGTGVAHASAVAITHVVTADDYSQFNILGSLQADVSVTGAVTITATGYGKMHACTGTSANYAVTLPDATTTPAGTILGFRMGSTSTLTKLVTLTSATGSQIDGSATRVMWSNETAIIQCTGTIWTKIAGKAVPMYGTFKRSTDQTITHDVWTAVILTSQVSGTPQIWDSGNGRAVAVRPGRWHCAFNMYCIGTGINLAYTGIGYNASSPATTTALPPIGGTTIGLNGGYPIDMVPTDYVAPVVNIVATSGTAIQAGTIPADFFVTESPSW